MKVKATVTVFLDVLLLTSFSGFIQFDFVLTVKADSKPLSQWVSRFSSEIDYGNGTYTSTSTIGPQVFWDNESNSWQELRFIYDVTKKYYLLQNAHMSLRVYEDKPSSYFDPDNQKLCVEKEVVSVEYDNNGKWQTLDLKTPVFTVVKNDSSEVRLTKISSSKDGVLNLTYILKPASFLKHEIIFKSSMDKSRVFQVRFRLEGVPSLKVKYPTGDETISGMQSIGKQPWVLFEETETNLVLTELLWSLGQTNEITLEWTPTLLQDVIVDVENGKGKVDIVIGNYTLAKDENLLIDPDSSTFYVSSGNDDARSNGNDASFYLTDTYLEVNTRLSYEPQYRKHVGLRFPNATIPQGSTVTAASLSIYSYTTSSDDMNAIIYGDDVDNSAAFNVVQKIWTVASRPRTTASVTWATDSLGIGWVTKTGLESIAHEIVNRASWVSGNAITLLLIANQDNVYKDCVFNSYEGGYPAYITVTWTPPAAGDTTPPTYSGITTNSTIWGTSCNFSILINDETALHPNGQYIFGTNNTGTFTNETAANFTATPNGANVIKTLNATHSNATEPEIIQFEWWFTDNAGNSNDTGLQTLLLYVNLTAGWNNVTIFSFDTGFHLAGINASLTYDGIDWSYIVFQNSSTETQYVFCIDMSYNGLIEVNDTDAILLIFCGAAANWTHTFPYQGGDYGSDPAHFDVWPDGKIDMRDIATVARHYGTIIGQPYYQYDCDMNSDGYVDMQDIIKIAKLFGTEA